MALFEVVHHIAHELFGYDAILFDSRTSVGGVHDHLLDVNCVRHFDLYD